MDFVTCPSCGQVQARAEDGKCIKCGAALTQMKVDVGSTVGERSWNDPKASAFQKGTHIRECPHCGSLQNGGDICRRCGKGMRNPLRVSAVSVFLLVIGVFFAALFAMLEWSGEESAWTALVPMFIFGGIGVLSLYGSFSRAGKFIEGELLEAKRRASMVQFTFPKVQNLPGFSGNGFFTVLADTENEQVIFCQSGKPESEKYLSFRQVIDAKVEVTSRNIKKSPVGRSIVGAAIAGPVGAVVGSASGVGEKTVFESAFVIKYRPSNRDTQEEIRFPIEGLGDLTVPKFCEKFRRELKLEKEKLEPEKETGKYL